MHLIKKYKHFLPFFIINAVFFVIVIVNISLDKNLLGWDSINPEFNFFINFKRSFSSLWQENYGLGTLAGHGFASTLPHTIVIYLLSFLLPKILLRTVFTFLCFYIGGLGLYFLSKKIIPSIKRFHIAPGAIDYLALIGVLFYWVNLGTIQMFYIQLEAFIIHFAALPWLFLILIKTLDSPSKTNLFFFFLINFFASGQGFIPPLFVAYCFALGIFLTGFMLHFRSIQAVKKSILIVLLTLVINSYWMIPLGYYTVTRSNIYLNSYNNLVSTPEFINKNKKFGDLPDVALIKGFIFEAVDSSGPQYVKYVFEPWVEHHNNQIILLIGWGCFAVTIIGVLAALFYLKSWIATSFAGIFLFFFTGLTTDVFPFSLLTQFLQNYMPIYRQAFRAAFTKFSIGVAFSYSIFFVIGTLILLHFLVKWFKHKSATYLTIGAVLVLLFYYGLPLFKGNFFYERLKNNLPSAYSEIMAYFKTQEDGRIADFPQDCPEGWYSYNWRYTGSGFFWYGVRQPFLSRTFDVWNNSGENYYWEVTQAIREKNFGKVDAILEKYNIKWVLYDRNMMHCRDQKALLPNEPLLDYMKNSTNYTFVKSFQSSSLLPIDIYIRNKEKTQSFIKTVAALPDIGPVYKWNDEDTGYFTYGDYVTTDNTNVYYPFRSLFSKRKAQESDVSIQEDADFISLTTPIAQELKNRRLIIPPYALTEKILPISLSLKKKTDNKTYDINITYRFPLIKINDQPIAQNEFSSTIGTVQISSIPNLKVSLNGENINWDDLNAVYNTFLYTQFSNNLIFVNPATNIASVSWSSDNDPVYKVLTERQTSVSFSTGGGNLSVTYPKFIQNSSLSGDTQTFEKAIPKPCNEIAPNNRNTYSFNEQGETSYIRLVSQNSRQCLTYHFYDFLTSYGYLVGVKMRKITGTNPAFYISNANKTHYLDVFLYGTEEFKTHYFIIPPTFPDSISYDMYYDNFSQNSESTITDFSSITAYQIPYNFLKNLKITDKNSFVVAPDENTISNIKHPLETFYSFVLNNGKSQYLYLSQSFDSGWKAYIVPDNGWINRFFPFFQGEEIKNHVLLNNWANGWKLKENNALQKEHIIIIYWPQYLQFIGYGMLITTFLYIILIYARFFTSSGTKSERGRNAD